MPENTLAMTFFTLWGYWPVVEDEGRVSPSIPNLSVASFTGASVGPGSVMVPEEGWQTLLGEQVLPAPHVPQLSVPPQPSAIVPHELDGQVFGMHVWVTHTLFVHVALAPQVPHESVPPQPSGIVPQFFPCAEQVVGVQPVPAWQAPWVHVSPTGQLHVIVPPHPLETVPQALPTPPEPHVMGTHAGWHVPLPDPVQVSPETQPQLSVPPQPLGTAPQVSPWLPAGHARVVHPHWFATPPPPHVWGAAQVPQLTVPPLPSGMVPQLALAAIQRAGPPEDPVPHAWGEVGGLLILHCECQCSSATQAASQVAPLPNEVQQWVVEEKPQTAVTHPAMLVPLSQPLTSAPSVHVRSWVHVPGPLVVPAPHKLFVQVWPLGQTPQLSVPPQPSDTEPQVARAVEQVFGVQPVEHTATGFCVGVGQSLKPKPAAFVNVAANWAQPLSQVLVQQYACAESEHTS
jgi:hypothetical protein